ncbi:MAG: hypothetical protein ACE5F1_08650 [Planctomycetota bacterium]
MRKLQKEVQQLRTELDEMGEELDSAKAGGGGGGTTKMLLTGYTDTTFTDKERSDSAFNTKFFPIFLWELDKRLLFEAELEVELGSSDTEVALEFGDLTYILNDYITFRAGKFMSPVSRFKEVLHPSWINKLPDQPLYATGSRRLIPTSSLGLEIRGGVPVGNDMKATYSVYSSNGPALKTGAGDAGRLNFKNNKDNNNNKAIGVAAGFFPMPNLEVGGSFQFSRVGASGSTFDDVDATLASVNFHYQRESEHLKGSLEVLAEWLWSDADDATYDPTGSAGFGPLTFDNERNGGYFQLSYRPEKVENEIFQKLEGVIRYDALNLPAASPGGIDESRITFGLNYPLGDSTILKIAYQVDDINDQSGTTEDADALLLQVTMGF